MKTHYFYRADLLYMFGNATTKLSPVSYLAVLGVQKADGSEIKNELRSENRCVGNCRL